MAIYVALIMALKKLASSGKRRMKSTKSIGTNKVQQRRKRIKAIKKLAGIFEGGRNEDAQVYVNQLRS